MDSGLVSPQTGSCNHYRLFSGQMIMVIPTVFANFWTEEWSVLNRNQRLLYKGNLNDIMHTYYSDTPFIYFI